jgi:hypothetical protein
MEKNKDIFEQFRTAADHDQSDFDGLEKVWSRVGDRLDKHALKSQNRLWKKVAVAASVLAVISLGYHYNQDNHEVETTEKIVVKEKILPIQDHYIDEPVDEHQAVVKAQPESKQTSPSAKSETIILTDTIEFHAVAEVRSDKEDATAPVTGGELPTRDVAMGAKDENSGGKWLATKVHEARSVDHGTLSENYTTSLVPQNKPANPLMVLDGKVITDASTFRNGELKALNPDDVVSISLLQEPLYIINGVEYSEKSLFSATPSSPYAPLTAQDIISIEIFQDKEATDRFGSKGAKGVVVIKTAQGKPKAK